MPPRDRRDRDGRRVVGRGPRARRRGRATRQLRASRRHRRLRQRAHDGARTCAGSAASSATRVALLDRAYDRLRLSARACDRVIKVAQTIADLDGAASIRAGHVAESLSYRARSVHEG